MEFHSKSPSSDQDTSVASIGEVSLRLLTPTALGSLEDLKQIHTQKVEGIQDRCARLSEAGYHRGPFQSIKSVSLNEEGNSALGCIGLPEDFDHDHNAYYHAHPAILDGAVQMVGLLTDQLGEGEAWVPAGVSRVTMYAVKEFHNDKLFWAHAKLEDDCPTMKLFDVEIIDHRGPIIVMDGVHCLQRGARVPLSLNIQVVSKNIARDVGIIAFEYYCPNLCISASALEDFHNCKGQYTNMTFCSDDEDAVSMAMTSLSRLMQRCGLSYVDIGRLEVGTESQVDRAKSIKSFLMTLFEQQGCYDVLGADTYNACYGGTNALFNALAWIQGDSWNGKYAIVICSDTAVHPDLDHLSAIGASSVAMLIGPNAPFVVEPERATFMKHSWDFYRPIGWKNNDAIVDWDGATDQHEEALVSCQESFSSQHGTEDLLSLFDYAAFHCNAPYHAKRSFRLMCESIAGEQLSRAEHERLYLRHVEAGTAISAQNATTYTCPLYACLLSLVLTLEGGDLVGKRILCFSYGSGCAASMYGIRVKGVPLYPADLIQCLKSRVPKTVKEAIPLINAFEEAHGHFGFVPSHKGDRQVGAYYLVSVDSMGVRQYMQHVGGVHVERDPETIITRIEFLQETMDKSLITAIIGALEPG